MYRDEQRARSSQDALVDTSPVDVVVFDTKTGQPVLFNREARRIVEGLRTPGCRLEQLLEVLTCRFSDEREVARAEFSMKRVTNDAGFSYGHVLTYPTTPLIGTCMNLDAGWIYSHAILEFPALSTGS